VGFPEGYQENFKLMFVYDRVDNRQVRVVCGNELAASVKPGEPFPHGSILVMESWRAKLDADGKVVKDSSGHFIRETLAGIFVMRKEAGFGVDYQNLRTGEWEYVAYRPDKSHLTPPENTANCAACHVGATEDRDWIFRANELVFVPGQYAAAPASGQNEIATNSMAFFPRNLSVKIGTPLTWINHDVVPHTMTTNDGSVDSGLIEPEGTFSFTFNAEGTIEYHCALHPEQMRATIVVTQ
jgi:hemoglobin